MMNINHKGTECVVKKGLLCQEGYCSECELYMQKKRIKATKIHTVDEESLKRNVN